MKSMSATAKETIDKRQTKTERQTKTKKQKKRQRPRNKQRPRDTTKTRQLQSMQDTTTMMSYLKNVKNDIVGWTIERPRIRNVT